MSTHALRIASVLTFLVVVLLIGGSLLVDAVRRYTPHRQVSDAWQMAKLSGAYEFRSEVEQTTNYQPRLSNYARPSVRETFLVEGSVDESKQILHLKITNQTNVGGDFEIKRLQGRSYVRQQGGKWLEVQASQDVSQLNALSYLSGMRDITLQDAETLSYGFIFDGAQFSDYFARMLISDKARGVAHNQEWYAVAQSEQLRSAVGAGTLQIDQDGLPRMLSISMTLPASQRAGEVHASITTTFANYARTGIALKRMMNQPLYALSVVLGVDTAMSTYTLFVIGMLLVFLWGWVVVVKLGRRLMTPFVLLVIGVLVTQPLTNVPKLAAAPPSTTTTTPSRPEVPFNPRVAPIDQRIGTTAVTLPAAGAQTADQMTLAQRARGAATRSTGVTGASVTGAGVTDSDGDGLSDSDESLLGTNAQNTDTDSDGLSDAQEVQIGTNPSDKDTDRDGMSDLIEVKFPSVHGSATYYTSPFDMDTNGDGLDDVAECPEHLNGGTQPCRDSDGDAIPDFLDVDNDNDGVADEDDMVPNAGRLLPYTETAPFTYSITDSSSASKSLPLVVSFQLRPDDDRLLYSNGAVYDWPANDKQGQVQRVGTSTFAASLNNPASDSSAGNGDMKVSGMVEIRVPISASSYGNLPLKPCVATNTCVSGANDVTPAWLDTSKLVPYGINAVWSTTSKGQKRTDEVTLLVPINPVYDVSGSIVAYESIMYYETSTRAWENVHQARLMWIISAMQDVCPPDKADCSDSERVSRTAPVQNYYTAFRVTGVKVSETQPFKSTVIYEDVAQASVNGSQRRLQMSKVLRVLDNAFMNTPFLEVAGTDSTKSVASLFDNRKNASLTTLSIYGVDPTAVRTASFEYTTPFESIKISGTEIPKILNQLACRTTTSTESCGQQDMSAVLNACTNDMTPRCKPAVVIASEGRERTALLSATTNQISFSGVGERVTRSLNGQMFKVSNGKWAPYENFDVAQELIAIQAQVTPAMDANGGYVGKPTSVSNSDWQKLFSAVTTATMSTFFQPETATYYANTLGTQLNGVAASSFQSVPQPNWNSEITNIVDVYQPYFVQALNTSAPAEEDDGSSRADNINSQTSLSSGVIASIGGIIDADSVRSKGIGSGDTAVAAGAFIVGGVETFFPNAMSPKAQNIVDNVMNAVTVVMAVADTISAIKDYTEAIAEAVQAGKTAVEAANSVNKVASLTDTVGKKLGIVGLAIGIATTWVTAIISIKNAEFAYQKANAISQAIGQTVTAVLMFVLAATGIGAIIAAIIGVLDALANLICKNISPEKQRSTAGQWLCGGISGILANIFSPFAANLVIDPADPYSRKQDVIQLSPNLANASYGFRLGNGWTTNMKVVDYIDRMPFPTTWMALPYFWQWNAQDERDSVFAYTLDANQVDLTGSISRGQQFNDWRKNTNTSDDYKGFEWYKEVYLSYTTDFTQSGINQSLPPVWMSEAQKVAQQNCIAIWIPLPFFPFPIPVCYIKTHQDTKYTNLNEDDTTIFDVFPETFLGFSTMQAKGSGYTFAWSPEVDGQPTFPVFVDADNDGVPLTLELTTGTLDNTYDSDLDGIDDNREIALTTNPRRPDSDGDGLSDLDELRYATDPMRIDSDGDGLMDGEEIVRSVRGMRVGGWEVTYAIINGVAQTTWVGSDPNSSDADGDNIIDLRERILGWSPHAKNSGEVVTSDGTVSEGLNPILVADFEQNSANRFPSSGLSGNPLVCVGGCPLVESYRPNTKHVTLNGSQQLNAGTSSLFQFGEQLSVAAWVYPTRPLNTLYPQQYDAIIGQYGQFQLMRRSNGMLAFSVNTTTGKYEVVTAVSLLLRTWTHVALTYDGATLIIYINGAEATRYAIKGRLVDTDTLANDVRVGGWQKSRGVMLGGRGGYESGTAYMGSLDDVALYQVALRAAEVNALMQNTLSTANNDLVVRPGDRVVAQVNLTNKLLGRSVRGITTLMSPTAGYPEVQVPISLGPGSATDTSMVYTVPGMTVQTTGNTLFRARCLFANNQLCLKLDDTDINGVFTDISEYNRSVTCTVSTAACPRLSGGTRVFDGQSGSPNVVVERALGDSISQRDFTIAMWVRPQGQSTVTRSMLVNNSLTMPFRLDLASERPRFKLGTSAADLTAPSALPLGQWSHLVFRMTSGIRSIYVNGALVANDTNVVNYVGSIGGTVIGADSNRNFMLGNIRDIQVYADALSNSQISTLATNCDDATLLTCLPFGGASVSAKSVDYAQAALDQGIRVDTGGMTTTGSSSGTVRFTSSATFPQGYARMLGGQEFTVVFKVRFANFPFNESAVVFSSQGATPVQIALPGTTISAPRPVKFSVGSAAVSVGALAPNTWYLVTARYAAGHMSVFVNGLDGAGAVTTTTAHTQVDTTLAIADTVSFGHGSAEFDSMRMFLRAVPDDAIRGLAEYELTGVQTGIMMVPPTSAMVAIESDTRVKVIQSDPNFERLPDDCAASSVVTCVPLNTTVVANNVVQACGANCPVIGAGGSDFAGGKFLSLNPATTNSVFTGSGNYTVMAWVKLNTNSGDQAILIDKNTAFVDCWRPDKTKCDQPSRNNRLLRIIIRSGRLHIGYFNNDLNGATTLYPNTWYHVAFVKGSSGRRLYVNGVLDASDSVTTNVSEVRQLGVGRATENVYNPPLGHDISQFNGLMGNLQIHNTELSAAQIAKVANTKTNETKIAFDEPAMSSSFGDELNSAFQLSCVVNCPISGVPGRDDRAVRFTGNQGLGFNAPASLSVAPMVSANASDFTMGMWVRPTRYGTWVVGTNSPNTYLRIGINGSGNVTFERASRCGANICWPNGPLISTETLPLNLWSHVTVSAGGGTEYLYVNGNTPVSRVASATTVVSNNSAMVIGQGYFGDLDEIVMTPYAVTNATLAQRMMNQAPSWNLRFEDALRTTQISVSSGVTKTATVDSVVLPDPVPARWGVNRINYAARCVEIGIAGVECPASGAVGMIGLASNFNGATTLLQVDNGHTLLGEMAAGGTVQMMIRPDSPIKTPQTIMAYSDSSGNQVMSVRLINSGNVEIKLGAAIFVGSSPLSPAWNQVSFSFGADGFRYFQNGNLDINVSTPVAALTGDSTHRLTVGGGIRLDVATLRIAEPYKGGVDDVTFTPAALSAIKVYRLARSQFSGAMSKRVIANITVDADSPRVTIMNPAYVSRIPTQFSIRTIDVGSYVQRLIFTTVPASGAQTSVQAPVCEDAVGNSAFCPTFQVNQAATANVEGRYTLRAEAYDVVENRGVAQTTVLVDTTAPVATLVRTSGTYTTEHPLGTNKQLLTLNVAVSDPNLANVTGVAGSGVKQVVVIVRDMGGRNIVPAPVAAELINGTWQATFDLPFVNPTGFYMVSAITTDHVGNVSAEQVLAGSSNPIEVDSTPPNDLLVSPSPDAKNLFLIGQQTIQGRVSDYYDGRAALQRSLRVRLDFEAPDGAREFDNRANSRYTTDCLSCPTIANDTNTPEWRIARFNIDGAQQRLTIRNAASTITDTFSVAMFVKISDSGTMLSVGASSNPRLRLLAERSGTGFRVTGYRGSDTVRSTGILKANTWYFVIYNEVGAKMTLSYGPLLTSMVTVTSTMKTPTIVPTSGTDVVLGAISSAIGSGNFEDYFRGYIDDIIISSVPLTPADLMGKALALGSGTKTHALRYEIMDDSFAAPDTLSTKAVYFAPMNQQILPIIDAMKGVKSELCRGEKTSAQTTCPPLDIGFSTNAIALSQPTDGVNLNYALTTVADTATTLALRFRIPALLVHDHTDSAPSGRIVSLVSETGPLSMTVLLNDDNRQLTAMVQVGDDITELQSGGIADDDWHTLAVTMEDDATNSVLRGYLDGTQFAFTSLTGHWQDADVVIGAVGNDVAAQGVIVDDVAVFDTLLSANELNTFAYGYSTVLHHEFDDSTMAANRLTTENSPFRLDTMPVSVDRNLTMVPGIVGDSAMRFDGNDRVVSRDSLGMTFANGSDAWAFSTWLQPQNSTGFVVRGVANGYLYSVQLVGGKPTLAMAGMSLQAPVAPISDTYHLAVSSDGAIASMYINGTRVVTATVGTTPLPANLVKNRAVGGIVTQSSTVANGEAAKAIDGNSVGIWVNSSSNSISKTNVENSPWWQVDVGVSTQPLIDAIRIYGRTDCCREELSDFYVMVSDAPYSTTDTSLNTALLNSTWTYRHSGVVDGLLNLVLPPNVAGRYVRIQKIGANQVLSLAEVEVLQSPVFVVGTGYTGVIDDMRVYRRALSQSDIMQLMAMGWRTSTLTPRVDGFTWQQPLPSGLEVNAAIQSAAIDNRDNSRISIGEHQLWSGRIDTAAPRIVVDESLIADTGLYSYTVRIVDRNLDVSQIQTPCGGRFRYTEHAPQSLWYRTNASAFDGTIAETTNLNGGCELSALPDFSRQTTQVIARTDAIDYGSRYGYVGGNNDLLIVDVQNPVAMIQQRMSVSGTVAAVQVNRAQNRLYVISVITAPTRRAVLTIYDIPNNAAQLVPRGSVSFDLDANANLQQMAITTLYEDGAHTDDNVLVLLNGAVQRILSIKVTNPDQPTLVATMSLEQPTYSMATSYNVLVLAQGEIGVGVYNVDSTGEITSFNRYTTDGYVNQVFMNDYDALVIDDDEPYSATDPVTSPNTLRVIPLITDVISGTATLASTMTERLTYVHATPTGDADFRAYRIKSIEPYVNGDILMLSTDSEELTNSRISIVSTSGLTATLRGDTLWSGVGARGIAARNNNVVLLTTQNNTSSTLHGYQISDRRLAVRACDRAQNCATQMATTRSTSRLLRSEPVQSAVTVLNQAAVYTTTNQVMSVRAQAPEGVATLSMQIDDANVGSSWSAPSDTMVDSIETTFPVVMTSGVHTLRSVMVDKLGTITQSATYTYTVDLQAPQIQLIDTVVGSNKAVDGYLSISVVITDDNNLPSLKVVNSVDNSVLAFSQSSNNGVMSAKVFVPVATITTPTISLRITATDIARRVTTRDVVVQIDSVPPALVGGQIRARVNGVLRPLSDGAVITRTVPLNLNASWTQIKDQSLITLSQLEYSVETVTQTLELTTTLTPGMLFTPPLLTFEASKASTAVRARDALDNESVTKLSTVYVDSAVTPDYTLMPNDNSRIYRGWLNNACATLGSDARASASQGIQRFATTWDERALRMNWQGADWDTDGDLFIYLDTVPGGTVAAYRPNHFVTSLEQSVLNGASFVTLPANSAARDVSSSTMATSINALQQRLLNAQKGIRSSDLEGFDYLVYVQDETVAEVLHWNGSVWETVRTQLEYRFSIENGVEHTDIRIPFADVDYDRSQAFGMVAMATQEAQLLPWATFPTTNPTVVGQTTQKITLTPLINAYGWTTLGDNMCPRITAVNPDTTQIVATLTSTPNGVSRNTIADNFANTDPDAIAEAVIATQELCDALPNEAWCVAVAQLANTRSAGTALLEGFANALASEQDPYVGTGSVITYTLQVRNPSPRTTKPLYGIVQTYGGVWLTSPANAFTQEGIIASGNYSYTTSLNATDLRDYQIVRIAPIPPNTTKRLVFTARIDSDKAQATMGDRLLTNDIAKIEVRLTDETVTNNALPSRTVEWLNAVVRVDSDPPHRIVPDVQTSVGTGTVVINGSVAEETAVSTLVMEYRVNQVAPSRVVNCTTTPTLRWSCPITVPTTANSVSYRMRASDSYGQMSTWSTWYVVTVDRTNPSLALSAATQNAVLSGAVGGSSITISGLVSDTNNLVNVVVCDDQVGGCEIAEQMKLPQVTETYTTTVTESVPISVQPCVSHAVDDYTAYPIVVTNGGINRISSMRVDALISHGAVDDVDLWLRSPSGTTVPLWSTNVRNSATNMVVRFDDAAVATTAAISGTTALTSTVTSMKPDGLLSTFAGEPINGEWNVLACDRNTDADQGVMTAASLNFTTLMESLDESTQWSYVLPDTANLKGVRRTLRILAIDQAKNTTQPVLVSLTIDTVAPTTTVVQSATELLPGNTYNLFSGLVNDEGVPQPLTANIYSDAGLVESVTVPVNAVSRTWQMQYRPLNLRSGTYNVQFVVSDTLGNKWTSTPYPFTIGEIVAPSIENLEIPTRAQADAVTFDFAVNTGADVTSVTAKVALDGDRSASTASANVHIVQRDGSNDTALEAMIPLVATSGGLRQVEIDGMLAAVLSDQGSVYTWPLSSTNALTITNPVGNVVQIAMAKQITTTQRLLSLNSTGVVHEYRASSGITETEALTVTLPGLATAIAAGRSHDLALLEMGELYGWGANDAGQLTIPDEARIGTTQIGAGDDFSVALVQDGKVVAWGKNDLGQSTVPISATSQVSQIAVGMNHTLALKLDGTVVAWGDNSMGQSTVPISATNVVHVVANANASAAITASGQVIIWGQHTAQPACCVQTLALNSTHVVPIYGDPFVIQSSEINATISPVTTSISMQGLVKGRRYRYRITVTNSAGSNTYTGTFTTNRQYYRVYAPYLQWN